MASDLPLDYRLDRSVLPCRRCRYLDYGSRIWCCVGYLGAYMLDGGNVLCVRGHDEEKVTRTAGGNDMSSDSRYSQQRRTGNLCDYGCLPAGRES